MTASEIAFVQVVRRLKADGSVDRENEQAYATDRTTTNGWHIDAYEADISGFYGMKGLTTSAITWGMTKTNGQVTTDPVGFKTAPSSDFKAAASAWNAQATSPGKRTSVNQQVLPAIK